MNSANDEAGQPPVEPPIAESSPAAPPPAPPHNLKKMALTSALWTGAGFAWFQVIRFAANVILARLLFPEAFGLVATAFVFLMGIHLFADVGIRTSIIQHERGEDPDFYNTAWTLQIIRGFILFFVTFLLAWPVAYLRDPPEPILMVLLPLMGSMSIITGFYSTALYTLERHMQQKRTVLIDLTAQISSLLVTVVWAWYWPTVWPLAFGQIAAGLIQLIWSHRLIPGYRNRLRWDRRALHDLIHFGKWIYVSTAMTFLANQSDRLVVGYRSLTLLGVYHMASQLAMIPHQLMLTLAGRLAFPLYSKIKQSGKDVRQFFGRIHLATGSVAALLLAGVLATGPTLVQLVYDARYQDAGWMLHILAFGVWFQILEAMEGSILLALGHARPSAISNFGKVLTLFVAVPIGYHYWDFTGMIVGFAAGDFTRYVITVGFVRAQGVQVLRYDLPLLAFVILASQLALLCGELLLPMPFRPELFGMFAIHSDGGIPAAIPWYAVRQSFVKDYWLLACRLLIQGGVVVLLWVVPMAICWKKGLFKKPAGT
jgi:O-antigen/teichoic acid export membrane protein